MRGRKAFALMLAALSGASAAWISGPTGAGNVLTANLAASVGTATTWQWKRNGTNIAGATGSTYTQVTADLGTAVSVLINGTYTAIINVPGIAPFATTPPSVASATTAAGLTWTPGVYTGTPTPTVVANAYVNGTLAASNIAQSSYTPSPVGGSLVVTEVISNSAGTISSSSSPVTITAAAIPFRAATSTNYISLAPAAYSIASAPTCDVIVRQAFCLGATIPGIVIGQPNWGIASTQGVKNPGNSLIIVSAAIEIGGQSQPILFSGSRTATMADGANLLSDELLAAAFGLGSFARGTTGWVRIQYRVNAGQNVVQTGSPKGTGSQSLKFDSTKVSFTSGVDGTGAFAYTMINGGVVNTDLVSNGSNMPAPMIFGRHTDPAPGIWGDSKSAGTGDTPTAWGTAGMNRLLHSDITQASTARSGINFGCPSGNAIDCLTPVGSASLSQLTYWYQFVTTCAIVGYGTNNPFSGTTPFTNLYAQIRANSTITKIIQRSMTPRTSSTDAWATTTNQTPATGSGWGVGGQIQSLEASLLALTNSDTNLSYYQSLGERQATSGAGYWIFACDGAAGYSTTDGLHEGGRYPGYELNIAMNGVFTTKAAGSVSTPLRTVVQALFA